jgi:NAD-dependent DNA ligase
MSIAIKTDEAIVQSSKSFNSLLNLMRQRQPQLASYIDAVGQLDIAEALKELLLTYCFKMKSLESTSSNDLAEILGIDKYIASIIIHSVNIRPTDKDDVLIGIKYN